jgi:hypothetical protein
MNSRRVTHWAEQLRLSPRGAAGDPLLELDRIPWARILHWYGRATEVAGAIRALEGSDHARAADDLELWLENQDGLSHAAAIAVPLIADAVVAGRVRDQQRVLELLSHFLDAARSWITSHPPREVSLADLLREECLLPTSLPLDADSAAIIEVELPEWCDHLAFATVVAKELAARLPPLSDAEG